MNEDETIKVGVADLHRLITRASNADEQLRIAVETDQKWRISDQDLRHEVQTLRYGLCRWLKLPEDMEITSGDLVRRLLRTQPAADPVPVPWPETEHVPQRPIEQVAPEVFDALAALVDAPRPDPEQLQHVVNDSELVATTASGRRFRARPHARWFARGADMPDDLHTVWEQDAQEHVWERVRDMWMLADRPTVVLAWMALLDGAQGGHVVEAEEIPQPAEQHQEEVSAVE